MARDEQAMPRLPRQDTAHRRMMASAQEALGPEAFPHTWAVGQVMPREQAEAAALAIDAANRTPASIEDTDATPASPGGQAPSWASA